MRARLRKEVEGLEVNTIYELEAGTELFWLKGIDDLYWTPETVLEDWEILQPVSDTTKQAIRLQLEHLQRLQTDLTWRWRTNDEMTHEQPITDKIYKLGVTSGRGGALWPDEETYIDDELFLDECVSAVVAVLEGKD